MEVLFFALLIVILVANLCFALFYAYKSEVQQAELDNVIYEPYQIDKKEAVNILSGKEPLCGNHVNWLNEKEGLPLIGSKDQVTEETVLYNYNRICNFAIKNGWIANTNTIKQGG
jgi:hypothetical protein